MANGYTQVNCPMFNKVSSQGWGDVHDGNLTRLPMTLKGQWDHPTRGLRQLWVGNHPKGLQAWSMTDVDGNVDKYVRSGIDQLSIEKLFGLS